jgi:hypothetical protein
VFNIMSQSGDFNNGEPLWQGPKGEWVELPDFRKMLVFPFCCLAACITFPKVRGIPDGSQPLPESEKDALCTKLKGNWKLQPLQAANGGNSIQYTDVFVRDDVMILSGGMHNRTQYVGGHDTHHGTIQTAVSNPTIEQKIIPFRAPDGTLFVDNIGSILVRQSDDGGEVEFDNALGLKTLWQREWKRNGGQPLSVVASPEAPSLETMMGRDDGIEISKL